MNESRAMLTLLAMLAVAGCGGTEMVSTDHDELLPSYARPASPPSDLTLVLLPKPTGGSSQAHSINDSEEIAGTSGDMITRWTRAGTSWVPEQLSAGAGEDINEAGTIVGTTGGNVILWRRDGTTEVVGAGYGIALDNSETTVVGSRPTLGATAWVRNGNAWTPHVLQRFESSATGINEVSGINDAGIIVGYSSNSSGIQHAVKWIPSTTTPGEWDPAVPLDAAAGTTNSWAEDITGDEVVGGVWRCGPDGIFPCSSREAHHWTISGAAAAGGLGTADAWGMGVNSARYIVGAVFITARSSSTAHAFVWSPGAAVIRDLGVPKGYNWSWAESINNPVAGRSAKQIAGHVQTKAGVSTAALWILQ